MGRASFPHGTPRCGSADRTTSATLESEGPPRGVCHTKRMRFIDLDYGNIYIYWSKPGSINAPQKQDENRGFGPGQAAGRTPGKLGGNMPVKLAKIRGKKEQQTE